MPAAISSSAVVVVEMPRLVKRLPTIVTTLMFTCHTARELLLCENHTKTWRYQSFQSEVTPETRSDVPKQISGDAFRRSEANLERARRVPRLTGLRLERTLSVAESRASRHASSATLSFTLPKPGVTEVSNLR